MFQSIEQDWNSPAAAATPFNTTETAAVQSSFVQPSAQPFPSATVTPSSEKSVIQAEADVRKILIPTNQAGTPEITRDERQRLPTRCNVYFPILSEESFLEHPKYESPYIFI